MIQSLRDPGSSDTVADEFVLNLTESLLKQYSTPQLRSIFYFIEFHLTDEPWMNKDWREKLAITKSIEQAAQMTESDS